MKGSGKFLAGVAAALITIGIVGGAYYYGLTKSKTPLPAVQNQVTMPITTQVPTRSSPIPTEAQGTSDFVNPSATIENIKAAVESRNYAALEGYMAPSVSVVISASECCGVLSPARATEQLSYLNNGTAPWDFTYPNPIETKLRTADPANFKDAVIGTASNRFAVGFTLNNKYLIDKIFMVIDYKLIAP